MFQDIYFMYYHRKLSHSSKVKGKKTFTLREGWFDLVLFCKSTILRFRLNWLKAKVMSFPINFLAHSKD